jgi:acetyltransferase
MPLLNWINRIILYGLAVFIPKHWMSFVRIKYRLVFLYQKFARMLWNAYAADTLKSVPELTNTVPATDFSNYASGYVDEVSAKSLTATIGLSVPDRVVIPKDADINNLQINFNGPYAMKIVSDTIIHKTDIGGVFLNLNSLEEIIKGYDHIRENTQKHQNEIKGIMVEKMCPEGLDMIIGVRRDAQFGPVLVAGLGGIYTELFKMTSCRLLPVTRSDVEQMLDEIPGLPQLLAGYRGQLPFDRKSLVGAIMSVSGFITANRESIDLFEINPLRVLPDKGGVRVLDCVIKIK